MRLIASDMDGTLLQNGAMQVSDRAIELIEELTKHGVLFVAASGRQYTNLKRQFKDASKDMAFVCENGAAVFYQDQIIYKSPMDHELAMELCEDIYSKDGCEVLVSGQDTSYLKAKDPDYLYRMQHIVINNVKIVESFEEIEEPIIKISVFEKTGIEAGHGTYFIDRWKDRVKCTISGFGWLDFVNPDVNKGTSLLHLMERLNIPTKETAAFGDNYNDIEMLQVVKDGYVMENAVTEIKEQFSLRCTLVEDTLEEMLKTLR